MQSICLHSFGDRQNNHLNARCCVRSCSGAGRNADLIASVWLIPGPMQLNTDPMFMIHQLWAEGQVTFWEDGLVPHAETFSICVSCFIHSHSLHHSLYSSQTGLLVSMLWMSLPLHLYSIISHLDTWNTLLSPLCLSKFSPSLKSRSNFPLLFFFSLKEAFYIALQSQVFYWLPVKMNLSYHW